MICSIICRRSTPGEQSRKRWPLHHRLALLLLLLSGSSNSLAQADLGYNRWPASGVVPVLVVASSFTDIGFSSRRLPNFVSLVQGSQFPTVRSQLVISSTGQLDLNVVGTATVNHPQTFTSAQMLQNADSRVWRATVAQRALTQFISDGSTTDVFDRNDDGIIDRNELVILNFNASVNQANGGQHGFANPFVLPDGRQVNGVSVILLGDGASLSTVTHELMHVFNAVDLYGPNGATNWKMTSMASSFRDNLTVLPDPWHRIQFGWDQPQVIDLADHKECGIEGTSTLYNPAGNNPLGRNPIVVMDSTRSRNEYFIFDHRSGVPGESGIESAAVYADTAVPGSGLSVWSVQTDTAGNPLVLTQATDSAGLVKWDGSSNGARAVLAVAEDLSEFGSGKMIWDQLGNEQELIWFDGTGSGFALKILDTDREQATVQWRVEQSFTICPPRPPFSDIYEKPTIKFPLKNPLPEPHDRLEIIRRPDILDTGSVINPTPFRW